MDGAVSLGKLVLFAGLGLGITILSWWGEKVRDFMLRLIPQLQRKHGLEAQFMIEQLAERLSRPDVLEPMPLKEDRL